MNIVMGNIIKIMPLHDACTRTIECIEKHGDEGFEVVSFNPRSQRFGSTPAILVRAVAGPEPRVNKWTGWLPLLEIGGVNDV